jgi:membrane-bound lytic murein transglycosylase MltF
MIPAQAQAPKMGISIQMAPKVFAETKVMQQWNSKIQYRCLENLWESESHWNPRAHNKKSGAYGIPQFMPETWGNYKFPFKPKEASVQITAGLRYIYKRYSTPCRAWSFWQRQAKRGNAWY